MVTRCLSWTLFVQVELAAKALIYATSRHYVFAVTVVPRTCLCFGIERNPSKHCMATRARSNSLHEIKSRETVSKSDVDLWPLP